MGVNIMSELTRTTPSTSDEGGPIVQGVPKLPVVVVKVADFDYYYAGDWERVKDEVEGINSTDEDEEVATARVNLVVIDLSVMKIGGAAFEFSMT